MKKLKIECEVGELEFIESLFNMKYSGIDDNYLFFSLSFYAMAKEWKLGKLTYYVKLLGLNDYT